jgi:hypothetical protein
VTKETVDSLRYKIGERLQSKGRLADAKQFAMDVIGGGLSKKALKLLGVKSKMNNRLSDLPLEGPLESMPRDAGRVELRKAMAEAMELKDFFIWTDNCAGQYRDRKNLNTITKFYEKHRVHLHHSFAEVGQVKGPHDSAGKVLPAEIKKRTSVGDDLAPDAEGAFLVGKKYKAQS